MAGLYLTKISTRHLNSYHLMFQHLNPIQSNQKLFKVFSPRVLLKLVRITVKCHSETSSDLPVVLFRLLRIGRGFWVAFDFNSLCCPVTASRMLLRVSYELTLYSIKWVIRRLKSNICLGLASLQHVFDSLTDNGKGVLKLIIKEQINQIAKQKEGPTFKGNLREL